VFFWEEPVYEAETDHLEIRNADNVIIVTPHLQNREDETKKLRQLLDLLIRSNDIKKYNSWYYSPLALSFSDHLVPGTIIYDCMDELSAFRFAPRELRQMEALLMDKADIVFTGGKSLYEARQHLHPNIYCFPSSIDKAHFAQARGFRDEMPEQESIPHPRIGFYGVVDERFDMNLLEQLARYKPEWHFVILGPVVKIDPAKLPVSHNIHFIEGKKYDELPFYLAGWDVAMMPFAKNESTKYISPTKTPEYLAGGKPVVSTSIRDVVAPYGESRLVHIADTVQDFAQAIEKAMNDRYDSKWLDRTDKFLAKISWTRPSRKCTN
jgi:UDP-galactopyranose mutase